MCRVELALHSDGVESSPSGTRRCSDACVANCALRVPTERAHVRGIGCLFLSKIIVKSNKSLYQALGSTLHVHVASLEIYYRYSYRLLASRVPVPATSTGTSYVVARKFLRS